MHFDPLVGDILHSNVPVILRRAKVEVSGYELRKISFPINYGEVYFLTYNKPHIGKRLRGRPITRWEDELKTHC